MNMSMSRFITELGEGDELAVVTVGAVARTSLPPTTVTEENKEGLHGRVPGRPGKANRWDQNTQISSYNTCFGFEQH